MVGLHWCTGCGLWCNLSAARGAPCWGGGAVQLLGVFFCHCTGAPPLPLTTLSRDDSGLKRKRKGCYKYNIYSWGFFFTHRLRMPLQGVDKGQNHSKYNNMLKLVK